MNQIQHFIVAFIIQQIIFHCFIKNAEFMREENEKWKNRIDRWWDQIFSNRS